MAEVYIGIGSNTGDRKTNCLEAIRLLKENGVSVIKQSSMYETEPWGIKDQPRFINMAVEVETELSPKYLLQALKDIERRLGRKTSSAPLRGAGGGPLRPVGRWGPRAIDLDILLYNGLVVDEPDLKIPHPLIEEREFVLNPLSEIAPDAMHPALKKTIRELHDGIKK